jgi:hypothetical protein
MKPTLSTFLAIPPSLAFLLFSLLPIAAPQFIYPPNVPQGKTLSDYTSGSLSPIIYYLIHDAIIGSYRTPKEAFSITRCAKAGRTDPIYPSNSTFDSKEGHLAPDGTWEVMDSYSNGMFRNIYNPGNNLWVIPDFEPYVGNATTGHICWWELYSVTEKQVDYGSNGVYPNGTIYPQDLRRVVTLVGSDTGNYFASTPFVVNATMREGNRNYTWTSAGGSDNVASTATMSVGNRPTGNAAVRAMHTGGESSSRLWATTSFLGMLLGVAI